MRGRAWPIAIGATALLIIAFYFWTACSSGYSLSTHSYPWEDRYNALADAFSRGHLYLHQEPPAGLLALPDPFDPKANEIYRGGIGSPDSPDFYPVHDLNLYKGHFYITAGALPVVALFWPWHALGLGWLPNPIALALLMSLGFLALAALMLWLVRRFVPEAPWWMRWLAVVAAGLCTVAPYSMRRPLYYDTAQASGFLVLMLGLLLLAMAVLGPRVRRGQLTAAAVLLALTLWARPNLVMAPFVLMPAAYLWLIRTGRSPDRRSHLLDAAAMAVPVLVSVFAIGLYNHVRFGSFGEFGGRYGLTYTSGSDLNRLANLWPGSWFYLAAPLPLDGTFPFFHVQKVGDALYPGHLDPRFRILDPTAGILLSQPLVWWVLALPLMFWLRRRWALPPPLLGLAAAAVAAAGLIIAFTAFAQPAATQRYEQDFLPLLLAVTVLLWMVVHSRTRPGLMRRGVAALGAACVALGASVSVLTSFTGSDNRFFEAHPNLYLSFARDLGFVSPITDRWGWSTAAEELGVLALVGWGVAMVALLARESGRRLPARSPLRRRRRALAIGLQVVGAILLVLGIVASDSAMGPGRQAELLGGLALLAAGVGLLPVRRRVPAAAEA